MPPTTTTVARLARVIHPLCSHQKWFAVFIAYFDESGNESDCDAMGFAGLVAPVKNWDKFEPKWKARLRRAGIDCSKYGFHSADFEGGYKPFNAPKWQDKFYKTAFFSDLASFVDKAVVFATTHAADHERQRACYAFLMMQCLRDIVSWVKLPKGEKIACIFDRNAKVEHYARSLFSKIKEEARHYDHVFEGPDWKNKLEFIPLQAADMVAYEGFRVTLDVGIGGKTHLRHQLKPIFSDLDLGNRIIVNWHTEKELNDFLKPLAES